MNIYAKIDESCQQIGGDCPDGWVRMTGVRPTPDHTANADGTWELSMDALRAKTIARIRSDADAELAQIQSGYSQSEIISWPKQEAGARELTANPDAVTPDAEFVRAMAADRGIPVMELVGKIMGNLSPYSQAMARVLGTQQRREDLVKQAASPEDLETI